MTIQQLSAELARGAIPALDQIDDDRLLEMGDAALDQAGELLQRGEVPAAQRLLVFAELLQFEAERRCEELERRLRRKGDLR